MPGSFKDSLSDLARLSAAGLDKTSRRTRKSLADAEWKMSICLLAMVRTGGFRELGYATITEYGERVLNLSGKKLDWLLGTARALEHLPLLSRAFQEGKIGWGKVRALQTLATPETEREWLDYALAHSTSEVAGKVSLSPTQWKRQRALEASLRKAPLATVAEVKEVLRTTMPVKEKRSGESRVVAFEPGRQNESMPATALVKNQRPGAGRAAISEPGKSGGSPPESGGVSVASNPGVGQAGESGSGTEPVSQTSNPPGGPARSGESCPQSEEHSQTRNPDSPTVAVEAPPSRPAPLPATPRTIRLVVELTPDQYALYEAAETRLRARAGKRVAKGAVIAQMAESVLDQGNARARARHQVLIHTCEGCRHAWYDNDRGVMPVGSEVLEEALRTVTPIKMDPLTSDNSSISPPSLQALGGRDSRCVSETPGKSDKPGSLEPSDSSEMPKTPGTSGPATVSKSSSHPDSPSATTADNLRGSEAVEIRSNPNDEPNPPGDFRNYNSSTGREYIPNATLRALFARAGNCCERCGARGGRLDIHHTDPVCEGGGSSLEDLRLYCRACHTLHHQPDLEEKPWWRNARRKAMEKAARRGGT